MPKQTSRRKAYIAWHNMHQRCAGRRHNSDRYAGRGIQVCERWDSFEMFLEDMGLPAEGMSIERIDNDDGYSPENCRWATLKEQANNRDNTIYLSHNGKQQTLQKWAEELGLKYSTLYARVRNWGPNSARVFGELERHY